MKILDEQKIKNKIENRINEDIASGRVGGASVIVKQEGKVVYQNCFGQADNCKPLTKSAIFRLASLTKPITTAAILKQVDRGLVSIYDPIEKFIPEFADMEIGALAEGDEIVIVRKATEKIKILNLLNHTSGVGSLELGDKLFTKLLLHEKVDLQSIANAYAKLPLAFEPGSVTAYSPLIAFDLLARVVEITSGKAYDQFLEEELFAPLGMVDTTFVPSAEQWRRMVNLHNFEDGKSSFLPLDKHHTMSDLPLTYFCGGASLVSTIGDYSRFAEMLLADGKTENGTQLISRELIKKMQTPSLSEQIMPGPQKWGLGVRVITGADYVRLPIGSFGWSGAYGAHMWVDPENQITAVYMKNSLYDGGAGALTAAHFEEDVYL
ncbi:MAG: beta-lactamase family protein [Clostridia bacterium]|nr:beta-lactamase family protein [Clostridia bacterium]